MLIRLNNPVPKPVAVVECTNTLEDVDCALLKFVVVALNLRSVPPAALMLVVLIAVAVIVLLFASTKGVESSPNTLPLRSPSKDVAVTVPKDAVVPLNVVPVNVLVV